MAQRVKTVVGFVGAAALAVTLLTESPRANDLILARLDQYVDALRQQAGIRGLSAAIVQNGTVAWERGYGLADVEQTIAARPDTPFPIGGLTQVFSATLALRCAEQGLLDVDAPIAAFTPSIPEPGALIRHVLSHTSSLAPGTTFTVDLGRYSALTPALESCTGTEFRRTLHEAFAQPLGMVDTVPARELTDLFADDDQTRATWQSVLGRLAKPYRTEKNGRAVLGAPEGSLGANASTGVVSTVRDLARFDTALDEGVLIRPESLAASWTNQVLRDGRPTPTGLGWFVQLYNGERVVWQYGVLPEGYSALYLKIPARRVSVILLANTDGLAASTPLFEGDVRVSPFARLFLELFL